MKRSGGSGSGRSRNRWSSDGGSSSSTSHYGPSHASGSNRRVVEDDDDNDDDNVQDRPHTKRYKHDNSKNDNNNNDESSSSETKKKEAEYKPNFGLSGALGKDMQTGNVYKGVQLKFKEPPEARAPNTQWRLYVFKKGQEGVVETLHISKQSAYLMGRNSDIADIPLLHPSLSSQHAVLQYRAVPVKTSSSSSTNNNAGSQPRLSCQPYIMDLESTNGTFLNGIKIDSARYYQLKKGDVLTFGASTREYVLMTENTTSTT